MDVVTQAFGGSSYGKAVKIFPSVQTITAGVLRFMGVGDYEANGVGGYGVTTELCHSVKGRAHTQLNLSPDVSL